MSFSASSVSSVTREESHSSEVNAELQDRRVPRNLLTWREKKIPSDKEVRDRYPYASLFDIRLFPRTSYDDVQDLERWKF